MAESPSPNILVNEPFPHTISLGLENITGDVAFASINSEGIPGAMNTQVLTALGYNEKDRPTKKDLMKGFHYLSREGHKAIFFIVTKGEGPNPRTLLLNNLTKALNQFPSHLVGKTLWIPLMHTRSTLSRMPVDVSYEITLQALSKSWISKESPIVIAVPNHRDGRNFYESFKSQPPQPTPTWIIKFNRRRWGSAFVDGGTAYYESHYANKEKRMEYDLFRQVKPGDKMLGLDVSTKLTFACVFVVTKGLWNDPEHGEIISMQVTDLFERALDDVSDEPLKSTLMYYTGQCLFGISPEKFDFIRNGTKQPDQPEEITTTAFNPSFRTEGDHEKTQDKLNFKADIEALAKVISQKKVTPPIAIGLFGHWGSGKSFFMQKLQARIDEFKGTSKEYIDNVVHVKFNSWHYSDANLWASLMTQLFESLRESFNDEKDKDEVRKLTETLQISTAEKEQVETKKRDLETKVNDWEKKMKKDRARLADLSGWNLIKLALSDAKVKEDLGKFRNKNIDKIIASKDDLKQYVEYLQQTSRELKVTTTLWSSLRGWRVAGVVLVAALVFGATIWLFSNEKIWVKITSALGTGAVTAVGLIIANSKRVVDGIRKILPRVQSLYNTIENRDVPVPEEYQEKVNELTNLKNDLTELDKRIDDTKTQINDIVSGRKLMDFISGRIKDDDYGKQLGLISLVRRDFSRLDELLRKQHLSEAEKAKAFNPEKVNLRIDRIVLYIDDLDRCKEDVVIKVLEAVHLLLAFPLFVVIVGVDPRWLNNALDDKYKLLLGGNKKSEKNKKDEQDEKHDATEEELILSGVATTYDYLEKIFQIPFMLKPIEPKARGELIGYLLEGEIKKKEVLEPVITTAVLPEGSEDEEKVDDDLNDQEADKPPIIVTPPDVVPTQVRVVNEPVSFTEGELEYMKSISGIYGHTPRSINRYVNIYRIIKSHATFPVTDPFPGVNYIPVMIVLAVVVGYSIFAQELIEKLKVADKDQELKKFLESADLNPKLKVVMKDLGDEALAMPVSAYTNNLELVARFSFRTIRL